MTAQETFVTNAAETTLSSSLASGATTINVTSSSAFPSVPFYAVIDPDVNASREIILVDGSKTATTFTLTAASKRGQDGTTDTSHSSGAKVVCVPVAALWTDINDRVDVVSTTAGAAYTPGGTDVAVADGGTGASTAAAARTNLAVPADADVVKLTGDQTVAGIKTFSVSPVVPAPTTDLQAATKKYVDDRGVTAEGFRAYLSTNQTLVAATVTKIVFDIENFDEGADYDTATGLWTVPATGWYDVAAGLAYDTLTAGDNYQLRLYVNGVEHVRPISLAAPAAGNVFCSAASPLRLTVSDTVAVYAYRASAGAIAGMSHGTWFTAKRRYTP